MKFLSPLIVVSNMEVSKQFYNQVLGLEVIVDFGANVTLTGGIALQTKDTWLTFIHKQHSEITFGGMRQSYILKKIILMILFTR